MKKKFIKLLALSLFCIVAICNTSRAQTIPPPTGGGGDTFYVNGNHIYDPCGNQFVPRGINYSILDDWSFPDNITSGGEMSTQIKLAHPNIVRITWWIKYPESGRPAYSLTDLDSVITRFAKDSIVVDLSVVDLTGLTAGYNLSNFLTDTTTFRDSVVHWWTSAPVVALVNKHKNTMIVNIANEWGNVEFDSNPTSALAIFTTAYKNAIGSMRAAGITVPLVVNGPDFANDIPEITAIGAALETSDPLHSIIMAEHAYWATSSSCATNDTATIRGKLLQIDTVSYPVIVEETGNWAPSCDGSVQCSDAINISFILATCQQYDMGWLNWEWFDDCSTRQMTNDGTFAGLNSTGSLIVNNSAFGLAGHAIKTAYMLNGQSCSGLAAITGTLNVCITANTALSDATTGGAWSSSNGSIATVGSSSGVVHGVASGTAVISYTLSGGTVTANVTVNALASAGTITGTATTCTGLTTTLSDATIGGVWSSGNTGVATAGTAGVITGIGAGTVTISYTVTNGCGPTVATKIVTVNAGPNAGTITGTTTVAVGNTAALSDATTGGAWNSGNTAIATVNTTGTATGVAAGTAVISYGVTNTCGTAYATKTVTVTSTSGGSGGDTFYVNGNHIYDPCGNQFIPRGINYSVLDDWSFPGNITGGGEMSTQIKLAHPNIVRVGWWIKYPGTGRPAYSLTDLDSVITRFAKDSIVVDLTVMDLTGLTAGYNLSNFLTDTTTFRDSVVNWWTSAPVVALVKKHKNTLIVNIANEWGNVEYDSNPTSALAIFTTAYKNAISAMRAAGITVPLVVDGPDYANDIPEITAIGATLETSDPIHNTILAEHAYWATSSSCTTNDTATIRGKLLQIDTVSYPVIVEETGNWAPSCDGSVQCSDAINISFILSTCQQYGMGWLNWEWFDDCDTRQMTDDGTFAGLNATGSLIVNNSVFGLAGHATKTAYMQNGQTCSGVAAITGTPNVCVTANTTLSDATTSGTWSSGSPGIATVGSGTGVVHGVAAGTVTISYTISGSTATIIVTVSATSAGTIIGTASMCASTTATLSDFLTGGTWTSSNSAIATVGTATSTTVTITGVATGTALISYTATNSCGTVTTTKIATVNAAPNPGTITGVSSLGIAATTTMTESIGGGVWSVSNMNASISSIGVLTGAAAGTVTVSYAITGSCGTAYATKVITIGAAIAPITGALTVCMGNTSALGDASTGGAWASNTTSVATIGATGIITGIAPGTAGITYTLSGGFVTAIVTVTGTPPAISGSTSVCLNASTTLSNTATGGTWSSSNTAIMTVGSTTGILTGATVGTATITYTLATGCSRTMTVTVKPLPAVITGTMAVCIGSAATLTDATGVGISWISSNTAVATIGSSTGIVAGISTGTSIVTYTINTGCSTTTTVSINPLPAPLTGGSPFCVGIPSTISCTDAGGTWTSSTTAVATIGSSTGIVNPVGTGATTISYTLPTGCRKTTTITVNAAPAAITGSTTICNGSTTALSSTPAGGTWSSSTSAIASVGATGIVTGLSAGAATISYALSTGCVRTVTATVSSSLGANTGTPSTCIGITTTLANSTTGGTWSSSNTAVATAGTGGVVNGIAAGTANITYTLSAGCRTITNVTVNAAMPAITGTASVCVNATTTLSDAATGGTWSSSNSALGTVSSAGVVTGISAGTPTISYTLATGCYKVLAVTVKALPAAIAGNSGICVGGTSVVTDGSAGVSWSSSTTSVATIGASSGLITGVSAGNATITFLASTGCVATRVVTVDAIPAIAAITGLSSVIVGHTITLADATAGGNWSSSNTAKATVTSGGVVTGVAATAATISYSKANGVCNFSVTKAITITTSKSDQAGIGTATDDQGSLLVYPNPNTGAFTVQAAVAGTFTVYTLEGKEVRRNVLTEGANSLSLPENLAAGIYMCRYTGDDGSNAIVRLVYEP